jgi:glycosyltransferase involved in cell wall biosynthesis
MREAKALLVCSNSEGFGRMTAEAAFVGCMVIGKNQAGTKEVMDITGGLRFITDDEMLQQMMTVVKMSEEEYHSKVMYAQKCAKTFFSKEQYVDEVLKKYQTIIMR